MNHKSQDYSKPFSYRVPGLEEYELPTHQSVWDLLEKLAIVSIDIPYNVDEIRARHKNELKQLINEQVIISPEKTLKRSKGYARHSLILDSIKKRYFLGLKDYGLDVDDDVFYYFKRLELHERYLKIAYFCSEFYDFEDFHSVPFPKPKTTLSKKDERKIRDIKKGIQILDNEKQEKKSLLFKLKIDKDIYPLQKLVETIEDNTYLVKNYKPDQAMKLFLKYSEEIEFASITFLQKVIRYHLQQQKDNRQGHNEEHRRYKDRIRKKGNKIKQQDLNMNKVKKYYKNNPDSTLKRAADVLNMDPRTIKKYKNK
jgi:hypothetical protein